MRVLCVYGASGVEGTGARLWRVHAPGQQIQTWFFVGDCTEGVTGAENLVGHRTV